MHLERSLTLKVFVRDNNVEQALRILKKKLQRDGLFREIKRRKAYENRPREKHERRWRQFVGLERRRANLRNARA
jgi:small subunit ribosomal protein S21